MSFYRETISLSTDQREVKNVTGKVEEAVENSGIEDGFCLVFCPHTTAGITINEDESGLKKDLLEKFEELVPKRDSYSHNRGHEGNAHAHITDVLTGADHVLPVVGGNLDLGTWQSVLFIEVDGPRNRELEIYFLGE